MIDWISLGNSETARDVRAVLPSVVEHLEPGLTQYLAPKSDARDAILMFVSLGVILERRGVFK